MAEPIEAAARDLQADSIWRPCFIKERETWICQRYVRFTLDGRPVLHRETYGARMRDRFSPLYLFEQEAAQKTCDRLNAEEKAPRSAP